MPYTYYIDSERKIAFVTVTGEMTLHYHDPRDARPYSLPPGSLPR